jgi:putative heme-binding domain-containing protein
VLYYRMAKLGAGRMPHIGSSILDARGLRLIHDWIRRLPVHRDERTLVRRLAGLTGGHAQARERAEVLNRLLAGPSSALYLARAFEDGKVPAAIREEVLTTAVGSPLPQVRDLFERFLPDEKRVQRLGTNIRPEQILNLKGDVARGRELFFKAAVTQCVNCHRVGSTGSTFGPDLTQVGKKYTRALILENILEPSKTIEPKYVTYTAETNAGVVHTGLLAEKNEREVVLRLVGDKEVRIPRKNVASLVAQRVSLMPEQLLRDLTAQQAADLLDYLTSLK